MRLTNFAVAFISLPLSVSGLDPCALGAFEIVIPDTCDYGSVSAAYDKYFEQIYNGCGTSSQGNLLAILGANDTLSAEAKVEMLCSSINGNIYFDQIHYEGSQFTKNFYDGGTHWNEEVETNKESENGEATNNLKDDADGVNGYYELSKQRVASWPQDISNFDQQCQLNSAMCCWVTDRQANDNNGNCATPYDDNCIDKDPADNTDLCMVDLSRSPFSNNVNSDAITIFYGDDGNKAPYKAEGPVHCHGFAWAEKGSDHTARYKANNLFYISMYDHMYKRGYVRNVPGAPMCGCVEQMPIVSRSDCTQIDVVKESFKFTYDTVKAVITMDEARIKYNACQGLNNRNNDLRAYYQQLTKDKKISVPKYEEFKETVVGDHNCPYAISKKLTEKGFEMGYSDPDNWTHVVGEGTMSSLNEDIGNSFFREAFAARPNQIIKRVCLSCTRSHREIYYRRLTAVPDDMDLLDVLKNNWSDVNKNAFNIDFALYSSYEEALKNEDIDRWKFCDFNYKNVGFPANCGPSGPVGGQWNSYVVPGGEAYDHAFYIEARIVDSNFAPKTIDNIAALGSAEAGYSVESNGTYYIQGKGKMHWKDSSDNIVFAYQDSPTGDFTIVAKVSDIYRKGKWSNAGIMVRTSLSSNSPMFHITNSKYQFQGVMTQSRLKEGHDADTYSTYQNIDSPWFKIRRNFSNGEISAHLSSDGQEWEEISKLSFPKHEVLMVGMTVTSDDMYQSSEVLFEHFDVVPELLTPAPTLSAAPTRSPAPTKPIGPEEKGFCVTKEGHDQNSGVVKLESGNVDKDKCVSMCLNYSGYTGCEVIWNQGNKGCYVHTRNVARGNGVGNHWCWIK